MPAYARQRLTVVCLCVVAFCLASAEFAFATHYRGTTMKWERDTTHPASDPHSKFVVTYTTALRWSFPYGGPASLCGTHAGFTPSGGIGAGSCPTVGTVLPANSLGTYAFINPASPFLNNTVTVRVNTPTSGLVTASQINNAVVQKIITAQDLMYVTFSVTVFVDKSGLTATGAIVRWQNNGRLSNLLQGNNDTTWRAQSLLRHDVDRSPEAIMAATVPVTVGTMNQITIPTSSEPGTTAELTIATQQESQLTTPSPNGFALSTTVPNTIEFTPTTAGLYAVQLKVTSYDVAHQERTSVPFEFLLQATAPCTGCRQVAATTPDVTPTVEIGDTLTFPVNASASGVVPGGQPTFLTIDYTPLPAGMTVAPGPTAPPSTAATFSWTPTADQIGSYPVCFQGLLTQVGGVNNAFSPPLCMVINAVAHNDPPVAQCSAPLIGVPAAGPLGALATVSTTVSDPDANALVVSWTVNGVAAGFTNVAASALESVVELNATFPIGTSTIMATISDGFESTSCTTSVTVSKLAQTITFDPPATVPFGTTTVTLSGDATSGNPLAFTLVSGPATFAPPVLTITGLGEIVVEASAAATSLYEAATVTRSIVVADMEAPQVTVPGAITMEANAPRPAAAVVTFTTAVTDNVDTGLAATCTPASGAAFDIGTTTVTCTATDAAGNVGSASFDVTVADSTAPLVGAVANIFVEATGASGATASWTTPLAFDEVDGATTVACAPASGSVFPLGASTVTCTSADAAGNEGSTSFTVTVQDTAGPVIAVIANFTVEATSAGGAAASWTLPGAEDTVNGATAVSCAPASGTALPLGPTVVTCTSEDAAGNDGTMTFTVTVADSTAPAVAAHADVPAEAAGPTGAIVTFDAPQYTDAVLGAGSAVCAPVSGETFAIGSTPVTCSVTDAAGNTGSTTFAVVVSDTTPPTIAASPNLAPAATSAAGAIVTYTAPATSDIVDGAGVAVCAPASGSQFPMGATVVRCNATDARGNAAVETTFTVTITNNVPTISVPADISKPATGASGAAVSFTVTGSDVENGTLPATCSNASGSVFPIGATTVSCTVTDAAGASATGSFTVTVTDVTTPGEMSGNGFVRDNDAKYFFSFYARERASGHERAQIAIHIDEDGWKWFRGFGRDRNRYKRDDRFVSKTVDFIAFSDDPTVRPGWRRKPQIDTVTFSGIGEWNGKGGYRYEAWAQDAGEPGRHRETIKVTIWSPTGQKVAEFEGDLDGGNIRSSRIRH